MVPFTRLGAARSFTTREPNSSPESGPSSRLVRRVNTVPIRRSTPTTRSVAHAARRPLRAAHTITEATVSLLDSLRTIWRKKAPMPTPDHTTLPFVVAGPHQCDAGCGRRATLEIVTHAGEPLFFCQPHFDEHQDALLGQCLETRRLEPQR